MKRPIIVADYALFIIAVLGTVSLGSLSLAQTQPNNVMAPAVTMPQPVQPHPVAIGGAVGSPTYVIPPGQPQPKSGGFIKIGQAFGDALEPYVDAIANALIVVILGWIGTMYTKITGRQMDEKHRDALQVAFKNRAASLIAAGKVKVSSLGVQVPDAELAVEANDLLNAMPDAIKHFGGMSPEVVKQKIIDAIPQVPAGASVIAQAAMREPLPSGKAP